MRTTEPTTITTGERVEWTRTFSGYPAAEFDLQYRFRGGGPGADVDATADDDAFVSELTAAQTASFSEITDAGYPARRFQYQWQAWLTEIADATNSFIIDSGFLTVKQGFVDADTESVDLRTPAKIQLDALDAALLKTGDIIEYEKTTPAGGLQVKRGTRSEIISMRKYYAAIVRRENAAEKMRNGEAWGTSISVRMP